MRRQQGGKGVGSEAIFTYISQPQERWLSYRLQVFGRRDFIGDVILESLQ